MVNYDKLDRKIKETGVTKASICARLGKTRSWLTDARRNKYDIPTKELALIAAALQTNIDYLCDRTENDAPKQTRRDAEHPIKQTAPTIAAEADRLIDLEIMMKYAQLRPEDRVMIDKMIDRLLSQQE